VSTLTRAFDLSVDPGAIFERAPPIGVGRRGTAFQVSDLTGHGLLADKGITPHSIDDRARDLIHNKIEIRAADPRLKGNSGVSNRPMGTVYLWSILQWNAADKSGSTPCSVEIIARPSFHRHMIPPETF
jgi:hypothetical protein